MGNIILKDCICLLIGYAFGCIITAVPVVRLLTGKDIFTINSCNPGFANVMSNVGKREGVLTLIGDILKVIVAMGICWLLFRGSYHDMMPLWCWTGLGAVLGHNFPFWHQFHGGKGVAVTCAYLVFGIPLWGALCCILGGIFTVITGNLWIGAMLIPLFAIPVAFWKLGTVGGCVMIAMTLIMVQRNVGSLVKLKNGQEKLAFGRKKRQ